MRNNGLTSREREVLFEMAKGYTLKEICTELGISEGTAKSHIARIFMKLDVHNRIQALQVARKQKYIEAGM